MAEETAVEVDEAEQPRRDAQGEYDRHRRERTSVALLEGGLHRIAGVREDVPQQEDEDSGREGVQETLDGLRQSVHAGDRKPEKDGASSYCAQGDGGGLVHVSSISLVRTKHAIRSV